MAALLANIVLAVHLLWILFLIFGFVFVLRRSKIVYLHLGGLLFALFLNAMGWYCPLTYAENYFRSLHDLHSTYSTSFIMRLVENLVYPDVPESLLRRGEIMLTVFYILAYVYWAQRVGVWRSIKRRFDTTRP
jgi:hypothetical protein